MEIEYRVRPVTRYIVTRFEGDERGGSSSEIGTYPSEETAYHVGYALAKADMERQASVINAKRVIFPEDPASRVYASLHPSPDHAAASQLIGAAQADPNKVR